MPSSLYAFPTACGQTLRALARYPSRTAFSWPGGSITYSGATELIGRMQKVFFQLGLQPGARVAFLTANRADTWCSGVAAQLSRLSITWLHPLGSLDDQLFQIEDSEAEMLIVDADAFRDRGGDLAAKAPHLKHVFTLGPANYGIDLLAAVENAGTASPICLAGPDDISTLNYTGGTTGKSKGALRYHREYGGFANATLADFEIPDTPRYLTVAPISHVAGTKVLPALMRGGNADWLFPGEAGEHKEKISFSTQIVDRIEKSTGLRITVHQFRHAAGALILKHRPGEYELVRRILGHKSAETTKRFYLALETTQASEIFTDIVRNKLDFNQHAT